MRAHEFINEILSIDDPAPETTWRSGNSPYSTEKNKLVGTWVDSTGREVNTTFDKNNRGRADVSFSRDQVPAKWKSVVAGGGRPSFDVTGTGGGSTSKILSGVSQNIKTYLDTNPDVDQLRFTSADPSRTKAYSRMIDRLAPKAGLVGTRQSWANPDEPTQFIVKRAQPGEQHVPLVAPKSATPPAAAPATATKLPPPGKAIPPSVMGKPFTPSFAGSHSNSQAFQDQLDAFKRNMPRI
jgi:hypothetical protein